MNKYYILTNGIYHIKIIENNTKKYRRFASQILSEQLLWSWIEFAHLFSKNIKELHFVRLEKLNKK